MQFIDDILHLIYPNCCIGCECELAKTEDYICSICTLEISPTNFHLYNEPTDMDKLFWGRIEVHQTYAHLFFEKDKASQSVLFSIKYKSNPDLAVYFGKKMGAILRTLPKFEDVDVILPVPLHPKKLFIRGYNQSLALAEGLQQSLSVPIDKKAIIRSVHSESQTKKSRFQRWDNVGTIFKVNRSIEKYKHVIIIDDVITTGSTVEAMMNALHEINPNLLISIVTLAIAK